MMQGGALKVRRLPYKLTCDASRTIARLFWPGQERAAKIVQRVMALTGGEVDRLLEAVLSDFASRYVDLGKVLLGHYSQARRWVAVPGKPTRAQELLMGAYLTMEYAFESAALFNPSMVPVPEEGRSRPGWAEFMMSLRAVGEGHVSSIVFRQGAIGPSCEIEVSPASPQTRTMHLVEDREYDKQTFELKIIEMGAYVPEVETVLERLGDHFSFEQLNQVIQSEAKRQQEPGFDRMADSLLWLARSNYRVQWQPDGGLTDLVLFPVSESESRGMEDMRLVRFVDDDGSVTYYGTYTAFNGRQILPMILEVSQPGIAEVHTLNGSYAQNKGVALFPRRIDGWYAMVGRVDGENLYLSRSKNIRFWNEGVRIQEPTYPWEFMQIGNCGSPIETEQGWLLLTHGVGPMRRYCIGASLLDLHIPEKVIGRLRRPLLMPTDEERSGYVPNVVYSCGGMLHNGQLVVPYGISDAATGFAVVPLEELLAALSE